MTRIISANPIRSKALKRALQAEVKFQTLWQSLSKEEQNIYKKAHGFNETMPFAIDQFQGRPRIKENEGINPEFEQSPVDCCEDDEPSNEMQRLVEILTQPALVDPLAEQADLLKPIKALKPHAEKIGQVVKAVPKVVKATPQVVAEHTNKISENAKKAAEEWHAKSPMEKVQHAGQHLGKAIGNVLHHTKHHLKHEVQMYHGAGKALGHLATGKKWADLDEHHKKHLKHALVHAGITAGSMAMGDPTGGHAAHGVGQAVGQLLSHFGAEHAHHALTLGAGNVALKSVKDAYKKAISSVEETAMNGKPNEFKIRKKAEEIIKSMINADIPKEEWEQILHEVEQELRKRSKMRR